MMNGKEKLYFLLEHIVDARAIAPSGQPLVIDPTNDLNRKYRDIELLNLFSKLEKDDKVLEVLKAPQRTKDIDAIENLDPYDHADDGCWHVQLLPVFDEYYLKIQYEPEYQEFTGKEPAIPIRAKLSRKSLEKIWTVLQEIEDKRGITPAHNDISIPFVHFSKVKDEAGAINASDERRNILIKLEHEESAMNDVRFPDNLREYVYLKIGERYFEVFEYYEKAYKEAARNYQQAQQIPRQANSLEEQYDQLLKEVNEPNKPTLAERYDESLKDIQLNQHPTKPQTVPNTSDINSFSLTENVLSVNGKPIKFKRDARTLTLLKLLVKKSKGIYFSEETKKLEGAMSNDKKNLKNTYYEVCRGIDNRLAKIGITDFLQYDFNQAKINPRYKNISK